MNRDTPLSRLTTVRAGGAADFFARPSSEADVVELLAWAEREGLPVGVLGSGSNLLVSDQGFQSAGGFGTTRVGLAVPDTGLTGFERVDVQKPQPGPIDPDRVPINDPSRADP